MACIGDGLHALPYRALSRAVHFRVTMPGWTCLALVESGLAGGVPFELGGADEAQRRVAPGRIVEAVDVAGQGLSRLGRVWNTVRQTSSLFRS
jgi:hypothetical protein